MIDSYFKHGSRFGRDRFSIQLIRNHLGAGHLLYTLLAFFKIRSSSVSPDLFLFLLKRIVTSPSACLLRLYVQWGQGSSFVVEILVQCSYILKQESLIATILQVSLISAEIFSSGGLNIMLSVTI